MGEVRQRKKETEAASPEPDESSEKHGRSICGLGTPCCAAFLTCLLGLSLFSRLPNAFATKPGDHVFVHNVVLQTNTTANPIPIEPDSSGDALKREPIYGVGREALEHGLREASKGSTLIPTMQALAAAATKARSWFRYPRLKWTGHTDSRLLRQPKIIDFFPSNGTNRHYKPYSLTRGMENVDNDMLVNATVELNGTCYENEVETEGSGQTYNWKICMFDRAEQGNSGYYGSAVNIGLWKKWAICADNTTICHVFGYTSRSDDASTINGGDEHKITRASEPETCQYFQKTTTFPPTTTTVGDDKATPFGGFIGDPRLKKCLEDTLPIDSVDYALWRSEHECQDQAGSVYLGDADNADGCFTKCRSLGRDECSVFSYSASSGRCTMEQKCGNPQPHEAYSIYRVADNPNDELADSDDEVTSSDVYEDIGLFDLGAPAAIKSLVWDFGSCGCSGWGIECAHMSTALVGRIANLGIVAGHDCFCPGFSPGMQCMLDRLWQTYSSEWDPIDVFISHKPPGRYPKWPYNGNLYIRQRPKLVIGRSMTEVDAIPQEDVERINGDWVDEVWVPSTFVRDVYINSGVNEDLVFVIPEPVDTESYNGDVVPMELEGSASTNFLSVFKWEARKGWDVLLTAFLQEFSEEDDVALYLKTYLYGFQDAHDVDRAEAIIDAYAEGKSLPISVRHKIHLLMDETPTSDMPKLYKAATAFVLPSRGEGWGLPVVEAMAVGTPAIVTKWSGMVDICEDDSICMLIDVDKVEEAWNDPGHYDFRPGEQWAKPSVTSLRSHMRWVHDNHAASEEMGQRAMEHVHRNYNKRAVGDIVIDRINRAWKTRDKSLYKGWTEANDEEDDEFGHHMDWRL